MFMSRKKTDKQPKKHGESAEAESVENRETAEEQSAGKIEEGEGTVEDERDEAEDSLSETDRLNREIKDLNDRWRRAVADLDNYRKRTAREREKERALIRMGAILPFLDVLDDLERALAPEDGDAVTFRKGVDLIHQKFMNALSALGVEAIVSTGEPFDPLKHDALSKIPSPDLPEGYVAVEIKKGYTCGGEMLRHSQVVVAGPAEENANTENSG